MNRRTDPEQVMRTVEATVLPPGVEERILAENAEHTAKKRSRKRKKPAVVTGEASAQVEVLDERALAIREIASKTPEVRYREMGVYSDDEIKIVAAAIVSRMPLYKVASTLKCSLHRILTMIDVTPTLKGLMEDQKLQEKIMAQEAVDDCVKARVPAVVMWNAQHVLPEKYGDQVNMDNEDDSRIVIGGLDESLVEEAEAEVAAARDSIPDGGGVALLDAMEQERGAELAAAGGDVPVDPLAQTPPAPSLAPPANDPRFGTFTPAAELRRMGATEPVEGDSGDDFGGGWGDDDMVDSSPF